jgi:hypothetical protein
MLIILFSRYVGFGEWIGPTVKIAGALGKRAIGLDSDPIAVIYNMSERPK